MTQRMTTTSTTPLGVEFTGVSASVNRTRVLFDITVSVAPGSVVGVLGPNGSGKSTLLRCLYRALTPDAGAISVGGRDVTAVSLRDNARQVAVLTQHTHMDFEFTAAEIVAAGRFPHRRATAFASAADRDICCEAMRDAGVFGLRHREFGSLSGGEAQRVLIARAFAQQPRVLVLDEPTNHLDVCHQVGVLAAARRRRVTIVAALHDLNIAAQFCDRVVVLANGRVVGGGTPADILTAEAVQDWYGVACHVVAHPTLGVPQVIFDGIAG